MPDRTPTPQEDANDPARPPGRRPRVWPLWLAAVALLVLPELFSPTFGRRPIPYSTFLQKLDSGLVKSVEVGNDYVSGTLAPPGVDGDTTFFTNRVDPAIAEQLRGRHVPFAGRTQSDWTNGLLLWLVPTVMFLGVWWFLARRTLGQPSGLLGVGKSRARVYVEQDTKVTFGDVAGVDEAKGELQEVVSFLKDPASFGRLGARLPRGVLLVGPPGTGKTLLARAVAGEAGVPFFSINGSEFVELFVGVGAARVRDLFAQARQRAPCIIFIDEIDALGRARGAGMVTGANDEKEQTLNQLLAELDGFDPKSGVVLLAATNRPEILDPALLRAGRFDRQILVDRPDRTGRVQILKVHVRRVPLAPDLDLDHVAALTPGFTGADLANLVNEAALVATRRNADAVTVDDFTAAVERIVAGLAKRSRVLSPREREITAYHEMGHALVALATPGADPIQKVSIIPHGLGALGFTLQRPSEERYIATQAELEGKLTVMLGGRAAELTVFGELSTGAADDLTRATELARDMVTRFGMDDTVGHVVYGQPAGALLTRPTYTPEEPPPYGSETAREIESAVRRLIQEALGRALTVLAANRAPLDEGAHRLMQQETLTRDQLPALAAAQVRAEPAEAR
ncbi:MAG: ATP-dependent zinc metalloprotease FtsH [Gemmatimonadota bacterium]|nr:ATP-dependent zinc metalloprotease FtsH [Gemmatimonadota bacterium]MDE3215486.1 ATP-dependent zinc metalloprotease FtsH [Gemmatimonadota bacterium]